MQHLFTLSALLSTALASVHGLQPRACNRDNCFRDVFGTSIPTRPAQGSADCSSYMRTTVSPCPVTTTSTVSSAITSTVTVSTSSTSTTTQTVFSNSPIVTSTTTDVSFTTTTPTSTTTITVGATQTTSTTVTTTVSSGISTILLKRQTAATTCPATFTNSKIPAYASGCQSLTSRYSSVCACNGIGASTTTLPASTSTAYKTVGATTTTTTTVTQQAVVTASTTVYSTSTQTVTATSTSTITAPAVVITSTQTATATTTLTLTGTTTVPSATVSTCIPMPTDIYGFVTNGGFEAGLAPWTFASESGGVNVAVASDNKAYAGCNELVVSPTSDLFLGSARSVTIRQTLTQPLTPGNLYTLTFYQGRATAFDAALSEPVIIIRVGSTLVRTQTTCAGAACPLQGKGGSVYQRVVATFVGPITGDTSTLSLSVVYADAVPDLPLLLDEISLTL